jgi:hypothetical protein
MARFVVGLIVGIGLTLMFQDLYPGGFEEVGRHLSRFIEANTP